MAALANKEAHRNNPYIALPPTRRHDSPMSKFGSWRPYVGIGLLALCGILNKAAPAQSRESGETDLIARARQATDIRAVGMPAFKLQATVRVLGANNQYPQGALQLIWVSPKQWREELHLSGYWRVRVGGDHKYWFDTNVPAEPARIYDIDDLFHGPTQLLPTMNLGKQRIKKIDGIASDCAEVKSSGGASQTVLCFDQASGALVSDDSSQEDSPAVLHNFQVNRKTYGDFIKWAGHVFPASMTGFTGKQPVVQIHVDQLVPLESPDPSIFEPNKTAEEWDTCDDPTAAVLKTQPMPVYPEKAKEHEEQGVVQVYGVIEKEGTLSHLAVVTSAGADLDQAVLAVLPRWRYTPEMCGGNPMRRYTIISTGFWFKP